MNRRSYLAGSVAVLAGCSSLTDSSREDDTANGSSEPFQVGDDAVTDDGLRLTVEAISVETRFQTSTTEFEANPGEMFVFVRIVTENGGDEPQSLPAPEEFAIVADGEQHSSFGDATMQPTDSVEGDLYSGGEQIRPGVGDKGWLMFQIPRDVSTVGLSWFDEAGAAEELRWALELDEHVADLPQLEFTGFVVPETAMAGETVEIAFEIENTGGSSGTLDLLLLVEGPVRDEAELTATVSPGDRARLSRSYTVDESGELIVTVYPFETTERTVIEEDP